VFGQIGEDLDFTAALIVSSAFLRFGRKNGP